MNKPLVNLKGWIRNTYAQRTAAVESGSLNIDWALPEYRVSWSEIMDKARELGIDMSPVDLRLEVARWKIIP